MSEPSGANGEFESLLEYLRQNRGFDFTGYKRPSLMRRVEKRMHSLNIGGFSEYMDYLEVHPEQFIVLFNTILINVTSFFRDEPTWQFLAEAILPQIIEPKKTIRRSASGARAAPPARKLIPSPCSWRNRWATTRSIPNEDLCDRRGRGCAHRGPTGGVW